MGLTGTLLEKAARATPATVEERSGGWWLRHTDSATWWAGATLAHGPANQLEQRVDAAERFYADHASAPRFQICGDCPDGLDALLAHRGYRMESPIWLLTGASPLSLATSLAVQTTSRVSPSACADWLDVLAMTSAQGTDIEKVTAGLRTIEGDQAYVTVYAGDHPVAIGRAAIDDGWTGIFNMSTAPRERGRGHARLVLSALAGWAHEHGAPELYLQVEDSNAEARGLYDKAGFTALTRYHYRVRTSD